MMTLEEAIKHCKDVALSCSNKECALEHFQLFKWLQEYSNMLEKQGDTSMEVTCTQEVEVGNGNIKALVTEKIPVDSVKPKFHEDDWVVGANNAFKIISLNNELNSYIAVTQNNEEVKIPYYFDDAQGHMCSYHLWSIQDAKDGDVLVDRYNNIGIFQKCEGIYWDSYIYLGCDGVLRGFGIGGRHEQTNTHPATKEQRELLFKKIHEAEYEWDAEKKELNIIKGGITYDTI